MAVSKVRQGISAISVTSIPEKWTKEWFRSFISNFLSGVGALVGTPSGVVFGLPTSAQNNQGTNTFTILNGAKGITPTGGGYFYVLNGALHWVGSNGTDTTIAPA